MSRYGCECGSAVPKLDSSKYWSCRFMSMNALDCATTAAEADTGIVGDDTAQHSSAKSLYVRPCVDSVIESLLVFPPPNTDVQSCSKPEWSGSGELVRS